MHFAYFLCRIQNSLKNGFEISFYKNNKTEFFMLRYLLRKRVLSIKGIKVWYSRTLRPCLTKYIKFGSKCSKSLILVYTKNSMSNLILVDLQKKISGNVCQWNIIYNNHTAFFWIVVSHYSVSYTHLTLPTIYSV